MRRAPPRSGGGGAGDPRPGANAREQPAMLNLEDLAEAVQDAQNRSPLPSFVLPYGIGMTPDRVGELALRPGAPNQGHPAADSLAEGVVVRPRRRPRPGPG